MASAAMVAVPALAQEYHYVKVAEIHLPTPVGHGDIVTYDPTNQMVYVSLKDDGLSVIDSRTQKIVKTFKDIPFPNANYFDDNYVYVDVAEGLPQGMSGANNSTGFGTRNELVTIDKHTWQITSRVDVPYTSPDGLIAGNGKIYVISDDNNKVMVYSTGATPQLQAVWDLYPQNINHWWIDTIDSTGPDVAWLSTARHRYFQSVQSYEEVYNSDTGQMLAEVDTGVELTSKGGTKGSWLDEKTNQLWLATTTKAGGLLILDGDSLKEIKRLPASSGKDQLSVDDKLGIVYTFGGSGFDAYDLKTEKHIAFVDTHVKTTHSGDVSTATHAVYVYEGKRAALGVYCPVRGSGKNGEWAVPVGSAAGSPCGTGFTPVAAAASNYTVYFEFNKSDLTGDAHKIINEAAGAAKHGTARIEVNGYTDLAGTAAYNLGLSKRRAEAVRAALIADGISAKRITVMGFGKTDPAVPTPDGVREPRNRRAVVIIGPGSTS
ncbi:MAG TPA: OmpA family protein [Stellaceae bacterium]|nr:OmpA family protein [Stellaceae bacterium]